MNCLKKNCRNKKICKIYDEIRKVSNVIYHLEFDCEYYVDPDTFNHRRLEEEPLNEAPKSQTSTNIQENKVKQLICQICGTKFAGYSGEEDMYVCSSCGKIICPQCRGEISSEYDMTADTVVDKMLCKECYHGD